MPLKKSPYIWHEGKLVPWEQATVHVLSHALHYGSSVFEGIRVYKTPEGPIGFRLTNHIQRMLNSAKVYRMKIPYSRDALVAACKEVIRENKLFDGAYVRPIAYRGYGEMGVAGNIDEPARCSVAAWEWGSYLGEGGLEKGVDVCVSSWQRVAPNTVPALAKAGGNYLSSILVTLEARRLGFAEGIALNSQGFVSEGAGENLFLVRDGIVYRTDCPTAAGPFPYCDEVRYGVWSVTKSAMLNVAMLRLAQKYGTAFLDEPIAEYLPGAARLPSWRSVPRGSRARCRPTAGWSARCRCCPSSGGRRRCPYRPSACRRTRN